MPTARQEWAHVKISDVDFRRAYGVWTSDQLSRGCNEEGSGLADLQHLCWPLDVHDEQIASCSSDGMRQLRASEHLG